LPVASIPEQHTVALVRLYMVNRGSRITAASALFVGIEVGRALAIPLPVITTLPSRGPGRIETGFAFKLAFLLTRA
jgi:hypothetical protein